MRRVISRHFYCTQDARSVDAEGRQGGVAALFAIQLRKCVSFSLTEHNGNPQRPKQSEDLA